MISICIPIYNDDVSKLVYNLHYQCDEYQIAYEILLLDDASDNGDFISKNKLLTRLAHVHYYRNETNTGLANTRNKLGELAKYPYLLFIDSDAQLVRHDYIERYIKFCYPKVVCFGGCIYTDTCPDSQYILRWKYGKEREEGVGKYYSCFNFLVDKNILQKYPFPSNLGRYGYEDTLFGINIEQSKIEACFIDNPMLHTGLDTADVYMKKIKESLSNLMMINTFFEKENINPPIKLLRAYRTVQKLRLRKVVSALFRNTKKLMLKNLKGKKPSLLLLDFYKLGYLCKLIDKNKAD